MYDSQDVRKHRPPGKVLTVNLERHKLETVLEQYKDFIPAKKICF